MTNITAEQYSNFVTACMFPLSHQDKGFKIMHATLGLAAEVNEFLDRISLAEAGDVLFNLTRLALHFDMEIENTFSLCEPTDDKQDLRWHTNRLVDRVEKFNRNLPMSHSTKLLNDITTSIRYCCDALLNIARKTIGVSLEELRQANFDKLCLRFLGEYGFHKTVYLIHGFARSGKTTLANSLSELGLNTLSTSDYLHYKTMERFNVDFQYKYVLEQKLDSKWLDLTNEPSARQSCIDTAENPIDGIAYNRRKKFAKEAIDYLLASYGNPNILFSVVFNQEESKAVANIYKNKGYRVKCVNLRSVKEERYADKRELTAKPEEDFWNPMSTPEHTALEFLQFLRS